MNRRAVIIKRFMRVYCGEYTWAEAKVRIVEAQVTLRKLRAQRKMSREELALAVGVTYSTVANLEVGRYKPRIDLAIRIARVFGVPVESIDWGKAGARDETTEKRTDGD